jgi:hypothetical protein
VHDQDEIIYYQVDYNGDNLSSRKVIDNLDENPRTAKIGGYDETIYIVYVENDEIFTERSTNSGSTWSTSVDEIEMIDGESDGLSIVVDDENLHVAWSEWVDDDDEYDTYHRSIDH